MKKLTLVLIGLIVLIGLVSWVLFQIGLAHPPAVRVLQVEQIQQLSQIITARVRVTERVDQRIAVVGHGPQRYGDQPYVTHLDAVAQLLEPYGPVAQTVGYLHDVVEDTPVTAEQVRGAFGEFVEQCVNLVTDEPGTNRQERKTTTNAKLASVRGDLQLALIVKAADRLANLRMCSRNSENEPKLDMYRREHAAFCQAAFRPGLCDALWAEMAHILSKRPGKV